MSTHRLPSLARALVFAGVVSAPLAGAASGQNLLAIAPGVPRSTDDVWAIVGSAGIDSCVLWHIAERHGRSVRLEGQPAEQLPCPPAQLDLGQLPVGHYAVTAWITRELLATGSDWVTLGMYSDNEVARRLYHRLGFRCDHYFTSGPLVRPI